MLVLAGMGQGLSQSGNSLFEDVDIPGYIELDGDTVNWRIGPRDDDIFIDKTLTPVGFVGTEGIDWITVDRFEGSVSAIPANARLNADGTPRLDADGNYILNPT